MEKRKGRFVLDGKKTMRLGTEVYKEIVNKMLTVHIAYMERKMRSCLQCPPVCAPVAPRRLKQNPYTSRYKGKEFLPQHMLPTYLLNQLASAQKHYARDRNNLPLPVDTQRRIRRRGEVAERDLDRNGGDADRAAQNRRDLDDQARIAQLWEPEDQWDMRPGWSEEVREYPRIPVDRGPAPRRWRPSDIGDDTSAEIPDVGPQRITQSRVPSPEPGFYDSDGPERSRSPSRRSPSPRRLRREHLIPGLQFHVVEGDMCPADPNLHPDAARVFLDAIPDYTPRRVEDDTDDGASLGPGQEDMDPPALEPDTGDDASVITEDLEHGTGRSAGLEEKAEVAGDEEVGPTKGGPEIPPTPRVGRGRVEPDTPVALPPIDPHAIADGDAGGDIPIPIELPALPLPRPSLSGSRRPSPEADPGVESDVTDLIEPNIMDDTPEGTDDDSVPDESRRDLLAGILAIHFQNDEGGATVAQRVAKRKSDVKTYGKFWKKSVAEFNASVGSHLLPDWLQEPLYGAGTYLLRRDLLRDIGQGNYEVEGFDAWLDIISQVLEKRRYNSLFGDPDMAAPPSIGSRVESPSPSPESEPEPAEEEPARGRRPRPPLDHIPHHERYFQDYQVELSTRNNTVEFSPGVATAHMNQVRDGIQQALQVSNNRKNENRSRINLNNLYYTMVTRDPDTYPTIEVIRDPNVTDSASFQAHAFGRTRMRDENYVNTGDREKDRARGPRFTRNRNLIWNVPEHLRIGLFNQEWMPVRVVDEDNIFDQTLCPLWRNSTDETGRNNLCLGTFFHVRCYVPALQGRVSIMVDQLYEPDAADAKKGSYRKDWAKSDDESRDPRSDSEYRPSSRSERRGNRSPSAGDASSAEPESSSSAQPKSRAGHRSAWSYPSSSDARSEDIGHVDRERELSREPEPDPRRMKREPVTSKETAVKILSGTAGNPQKPGRDVNWYATDGEAAEVFAHIWHDSVPQGRQDDADRDKVAMIKCVELVWREMKKGGAEDREFIRKVFTRYHRLFLSAEDGQQGDHVSAWRQHVAARLAVMLGSPEEIEEMRRALAANEDNEVINHLLKDEMKHHTRNTIRSLLSRYIRGYDHRIEQKQLVSHPRYLRRIIRAEMGNMGLTSTRTTRSAEQAIWRRMDEEFGGGSRSRSKSEDPRREEEAYQRKRKKRDKSKYYKQDREKTRLRRIAEGKAPMGPRQFYKEQRDKAKAEDLVNPGALAKYDKKRKEEQRLRNNAAQVKKNREKREKASKKPKAPVAKKKRRKDVRVVHPQIPGESKADRTKRLARERRARGYAAEKAEREKKKKDKGDEEEKEKK